MGTERQELPPLFRRHVRRPRLTRLLDETNARAIVLTAPAGYGKTTLAAEWLQGKPNVAWYRATAASADVAALAVEVGAALYPGSTIPERLTQRARVSEPPSRFVEAAVDLIARQPGGKGREWLAIDDYQFLTGAESSERFVELLLARLPLRLLITTRRPPRWADARRRAYDEIFVLTRDHLEMTRAEASSVVGHGDGGRKPVLDSIGGWPVAVGLAAMGKGEASSHMVSDALFDFLADEVLRQEAPEIQDFMVCASVLPSLEVAALREILNVRSPEGMIRNLHDKGLVHDFGDGRHFHPLMRSFLRQKLKAQDAPRDEELVRRTIAYLRGGGRWDAAFAAAVEAELLDEAAAIVGDAYPALLALGRVNTVERWLAASSAAALRAPAARVAHANVLLRRGRFQEARVLGEDIAQAASTPAAVASDALFIAGEAALLTADPAAALQHHLLGRDRATSDEQRRQALWGAFVSAFEQRLDEASIYLDELRAVMGDDVDASLRSAIGRAALADSTGSFAGVWTQERVTLESISSVADPMASTSALSWFAYVNVVRGDYEMALTLAERALSHIRDVSLDFALGYCLVQKAAALIGLREFEGASKAQSELEQLGHRHEDPHFQIDLANLRLRANLAVEGPDADLEPDAFEGEQVAPRAYGEHLALRALAAATRGHDEIVRTALERARVLSGAVEARYFAEFAELIQTARAEASGVGSALEQLLTRARADDCLGCFVVAYRAFPPLLNAASVSAKSRLIATPAIVRARDHLMANGYGFEFQDAPVRAPTQLSPREREVYSLLVRGYTNPQIASTLVISLSTAKVHVHRILRKLGYRSRIDAVVAAPQTRVNRLNLPPKG